MIIDTRFEPFTHVNTMPRDIVNCEQSQMPNLYGREFEINEFQISRGSILASVEGLVVK